MFDKDDHDIIMREGRGGMTFANITVRLKSHMTYCDVSDVESHWKAHASPDDNNDRMTAIVKPNGRYK